MSNTARSLASFKVCAFEADLSSSAQEKPMASVRAMLDLHVAEGLSLYKDDLLCRVQDPDKLRWWLSVGGDPSVPNAEGFPLWWTFVDTGNLPLLDVLRQQPHWPRWAVARETSNDTVLHRWAWLDHPVALAPTSADKAVVTIAWLRDNVPGATLLPAAPDDAWLLTFWDQALEDAPHAVEVWNRLLTTMFANPTDLNAITSLWSRWKVRHAVPLSEDRAKRLLHLEQPLQVAVLRLALPHQPDVPAVHRERL